MEGQERIRKAPKVHQPGEKVRLREDAFKHVKTREWIFKQIENENEIVLMHENGLYGLVVKPADINWEE
jgi:hypothetical protein